MKLLKILEKTNFHEKSPFLKIIDTIITENNNNTKTINDILDNCDGNLKNTDNINIAKVFQVVVDEFKSKLKNEFSKTDSQLDILADIITRDGNCIMKREWFATLYESEIKLLNKRLKEFNDQTNEDNPSLDSSRLRDYRIYKKCLKIAYENDLLNNQDCKITSDEQAILSVLAKELSLSLDEKKLINYSIIKPTMLDIDKVIGDLKGIGAIFYAKKTNTIYVADEIVSILREIQGKEVADKYFRRVLRSLREPQINLVCKKYNIDRKIPLEDKIKEIIINGISFSKLLSTDIHKENTKVTEIKKFLNELIEKKLLIITTSKGMTIDDKIENLTQYFDQIEKDERISISMDGYQRLLLDLSDILPNSNATIKSEFQLQEENIANNNYLIDHNIKPKDILDIIPEADVISFCESKGISTRGNKIQNILNSYMDTENIYIENFEAIGFRNQEQLKANNVVIKEADLGVKFEEVAKLIFTRLGFNVDESLRKKINNKNNQIDIVLNLDNNEIILVECKTIKAKEYNKFSTISRQLKSYIELAQKNNYRIVKSLVVAPDFSDDFINECRSDFGLEISLVTASSLVKILDGLKQSTHEKLDSNYITRDVQINDETIVAALRK